MQENKQPFLIVGLGNPGAEYDRTRHNVGFMAVRHLAGDDARWRDELFAKTYAATIDGRRVIFAMPQTFMNDSGRAVRAIMDYYKIPIENLVVIHDDMDLPLGEVRTKVGGGSAGHNGIKSIDSCVGNDYARVRVGIDHPRKLGLAVDVVDWVLGRFSDDQMSTIHRAIESISF
jgi:PTH1 family peptidyl-tRNA hydrolase